MAAGLVIDKGIVRQASTQEFAQAASAVSANVVDNTVGNGTFNAAELAPGVIYTRGGVQVATQLLENLPTGALMDTYFPNALVGDSWLMHVVNATSHATLGAVAISVTPVVGFASSGGFIPGGFEGVCRITKLAAASWLFDIINNVPGTSRPQVRTDATVGTSVQTAAELGVDLYVRSGNAALSDASPPATDFNASFPGVAIGAGWQVRVKNANTGAYTITPGVGVTMAGSLLNAANLVIGVGATATLSITKTGAATWQIRGD